MDVSIVIATASKTHKFIDWIVDGILQCPNAEAIVVSEYEITNPRAKYIHEPNPNGSGAAYNLGAAQATGKYIGIITDDWYYLDRWWEIIEFMKDHKTPIGSFNTGNMVGIPIGHTPIVTRELFESKLMKRRIFNPALHHMYIDNDLSIRLFRHGITVHNFGRISYFDDGGTDKDPEKLKSKQNWYRLDGMVFNKIWGHRIPGLSNVCSLYPYSEKTDEVLEKDSDERVANDIYKDVY